MKTLQTCHLLNALTSRTRQSGRLKLILLVFISFYSYHTQKLLLLILKYTGFKHMVKVLELTSTCLHIRSKSVVLVSINEEKSYDGALLIFE